MSEGLTIPTEATIRTMDGRALCRLAFHLGLAPSEARYPEGCVYVYVPHADDERAWRPHKRLDDADAALRTLRQHGWRTRVQGGAFGDVTATRHIPEPPATNWETQTWEVPWGRHAQNEPTEAMALLRCACLARAAQQREAVTHGVE